MFRRVVQCAEGGALMAGLRLEVREYMPPYENVVPNLTLARALREQPGGDRPDRSGRPPGSASARRSSATLSAASRRSRPASRSPSRSVLHHSAAFAEAALSEKAHGAVLAAAKGLAMTAIDLLTDPTLLGEAQAEFDGRPDTSARTAEVRVSPHLTGAGR